MNTFRPERKPLPENICDDISQIIDKLRVLEIKLAQTSQSNWKKFTAIANAIDLCRLELKDYGIRTNAWPGRWINDEK